MVKVYALVLSLSVLALVGILMGSTFAQNLGRADSDPNERIGRGLKLSLGASLGFGMGGMAAEFSPLDLSWPLALLLALAGGALGAIWISYAMRPSANS